METKTIILSEKEGKMYEIHLGNKYFLKSSKRHKVVLHGSVLAFLQLPNKEEIAEKVVEKISINKTTLEIYYKNYFCNIIPINSPLDSLLSAIGEYKYFIITETDI